ncbi:MAG: universal stress protein [Terriglobales bacterium]
MTSTAPDVAVAIHNVLIATDFSECSQRALLHAVAAAHHFGSTLHVAHIVQPAMLSFVPPEAYMGTSEAITRAIEISRTESEHLLADVLRRTHCQDLKHRTWVEAGTAADLLRVLIASENIDLVVVGTHGRTGLRKIVLGSVAEEVFRHATCPVLTVGPHSWQSDPQTVRLKHVLFPTDFSRDSARALPYALTLAADFGAKLTVMHVVERLGSEGARDRARVCGGLEEKMRAMVSALVPMPPYVEFEVEFGDVAETLIQAASRLKTDLIAFGLKPPESYADRLPWMHAYQVVCEVGCPVLSLRGASSSR